MHSCYSKLHPSLPGSAFAPAPPPHYLTDYVKISACRTLSPTNSCRTCTLDGPKIKITAIATSAPKYSAPKHGTKFSIRYGALEHDTIYFGALKLGAKYGVKLGTFEYDTLGFDGDNFDALGYGILDSAALNNGNEKFGTAENLSTAKLVR